MGVKRSSPLNIGAANGASAIMTLTAAAGFAAVVQHTDAFNGFVGILFGMKASPLVIGIVLAIIVAFTSSPPAALSIALPMVAAAYIWTANSVLNERTFRLRSKMHTYRCSYRQLS